MRAKLRLLAYQEFSYHADGGGIWIRSDGRRKDSWRYEYVT